MADKEITIKRAEKRLQKLVDRYGIADAVGEIGKVMQEVGDLTGVKEADVVASADLPGGDMAMAVFSVVKKEDLDDSDDSGSCEDVNEEDEWAIVPDMFKYPGGVITWQSLSEDVDRFRDAVSANYGFKRDLVNPLMIKNATHPLRCCMFECMGVRYEVRKRRISVVGEGVA